MPLMCSSVSVIDIFFVHRLHMSSLYVEACQLLQLMPLLIWEKVRVRIN